LERRSKTVNPRPADIKKKGRRHSHAKNRGDHRQRMEDFSAKLPVSTGGQAEMEGGKKKLGEAGNIPKKLTRGEQATKDGGRKVVKVHHPKVSKLGRKTASFREGASPIKKRKPGRV